MQNNAGREVITNMSTNRMALNIYGDLTHCTSLKENIGKGRCNHLLHQNENEGMASFVKRAEVWAKDNVNAIKSKELYKTVIPGIKNPIQTSSLKALRKKLTNPDDIEYYDDCIESLKTYSKRAVEHREKFLELSRSDAGANFIVEERCKIETMRSNAHNIAMTSLRILNQFADENKLPSIYPGDLKNDHRDDIAESIFTYAGSYENLSNLNF